MSISSYQQKAFCTLNKDFYLHSCVSLKFNRSTGIQFLHDWLVGLCALELEKYQLFSQYSTYGLSKSWLFTIYMGKPVGSRFG